MSELFNLSINAYNINELKSMLNLQDPFTIEDIVNSENILREKLFMDAKLSKNKKDEIIKFLSEVKGKLIEDAGVMYIKPTETSDYIKIGVTRGGGTFDRGIPRRDIDYDNSRGTTKGFSINDKGNPILTFTALEMTLENFDYLMPTDLQV